MNVDRPTDWLPAGLRPPFYETGFEYDRANRVLGLPIEWDLLYKCDAAWRAHCEAVERERDEARATFGAATEARNDAQRAALDNAALLPSLMDEAAEVSAISLRVDYEARLERMARAWRDSSGHYMLPHKTVAIENCGGPSCQWLRVHEPELARRLAAPESEGR